MAQGWFDPQMLMSDPARNKQLTQVITIAGKTRDFPFKLNFNDLCVVYGPLSH